MEWRRGVEDVKLDVRDFRCGTLVVAKVDGGVLLEADGALGEITQLLKLLRGRVVSHCAC